MNFLHYLRPGMLISEVYDLDNTSIFEDNTDSHKFLFFQKDSIIVLIFKKEGNFFVLERVKKLKQ